MRYYDFKKTKISKSLSDLITEEQDLLEVKMSYTNLKQLASKIDAKAGLEFEMIVPDLSKSKSNDDDQDDNDENEYPGEVPDYSYDRETRSIQQILDFFDDGINDVTRLQQELDESYWDFVSELFSFTWKADIDELLYEYAANNLDPDTIAEILNLEIDNVDGFKRTQIEQVAEEIKNNRKYRRYYEDAEQEAQDNFYEQDYQRDWLSSPNLYTMRNIAEMFNIRCPRMHETNPDWSEIGKSFSKAVGRCHVISSGHGTKREAGKYTIEPDGSLEPNNYAIVDEDNKIHKLLYAGSNEEADKMFNEWLNKSYQSKGFNKKLKYELIPYNNKNQIPLEFPSPILTIPEMLADLEKVITWAKKNGVTTNSSTGLHMNVSIPNYNPLKLDYVKLALLLGDKYILEQFGRSTNTYCKSALDKVVEKAGNISTADMRNILDNMKSGLNKLASRVIQSQNVSKYTSIHPQDNRVEFRSPGDDWLNEPLEKLTETLLRFVVVLDAAMDPEKYKEEYYKKFYKLIDRSLKDEYGEMIDDFAKYMAYLKESDKGPKGQQEALPKDVQRTLKDFRNAAVDQLKKQNLRTKIRKGETAGERYNWHIQYGNRGVQVVAQNEEEALQSAAQIFGVSTSNLGNAEVKLLGKYEAPTGDWYAIQKLRAIGGNQTVHRLQAADRSTAEKMASQYIKDRQWDPLDYVVVKERSKISLPPPILNGRSSNPDGNVYIATQQEPETPLYRFMAASTDDARTVLNQWRNQYEGNFIYRVDNLQLRGQPRQAQTADPIGRIRAAGPSRPAWQAPSDDNSSRENIPQGQETIERLLRLNNQAADANYEIVRRDNYQPVFLFIANTPQDASRVLERYLEIIGLDQDSEEFGFRERAIPGSTLDLQRQRVEQSARAAVQSQGNNRLWQIVDSADGEVVYDFYLSRENNQQDANEVGLRWVRNNGDPTTTYSVREHPQETGTVRPQNQIGPTFNAPEDNPDANWAIVDGNDLPVFYFTRNTRQEAEAVFRDWQNAAPARTRNMFRLEPVQTSGSQPESIRWRILVGGEEVHRFWNRSNQGEANAVARTWIQDQIRRGLLSIEQGAEVEVVPVRSNQ